MKPVRLAFPRLAAAIAAVGAGAATAAPACADRAREVLAALDRGDYAAARRDFDAGLREGLPEARLRELWTSLPRQLGPLDRRAAPGERREGAAGVGVVPLHYGAGWFELQVHCTAAGRIGGLWVRPAAAAPPEASAPPDGTAAPEARLAAAGGGGFRERALAIGDGAASLPATLTLPPGDGPFAAVVLVHGSGPQDADETIGPNKPFRDLALGLAGRGVAVLRYVKRTRAHPEAFAGSAATIDGETVDDAVLAVRRLQAQPGIDPARVYLLGHSLGAMMAPRIAARAAGLAGAILLAAPATPLEDIVVRQVARQQRSGGANARDLAVLRAQRAAVKRLDPRHPPAAPPMLDLPAGYWLSLKGYDPVAAAKTLAIPLLVLQGGRDIQVDPEEDYGRWTAAFAHDPRVTLKSYPMLGHLFMPAGDPPGVRDYLRESRVDPAVVADIAGWIERTAPSRP